MDVDGESKVGAMASAMNRQLFGAMVVSRTLDYLNGGRGTGGLGALKTDYDSQIKILAANATGKGININFMV